MAAAAEEIEAAAAELDAAANAVAAYQCDLSDVKEGDGKTLCIDWFIAAETFLLIAEGDNRGHNTTARYVASRAHLYFNPTTGAYALKLNTSKIRLITQAIGLPHPTVGGIEAPPFRHLPRDVRIERLSNGQIKVTASLYNGFCTMARRDNCPSIDSNFTFTPLSNGQYHVAYNGDDYPSIQVNQHINGVWTELARRSEHPGPYGPTFLLEARKKTTEMKNNNRMPPNCELQ